MTMKKLMIWACVLLVASATSAYGVDGMLNIESAFGVAETADRFERVLGQKGMTLFNRIKHSEAATAVGIELRNTELLIFGNPKVGSPLMACAQTVGIDLPQKALVWKDESGKVWISYNDPRYLKVRHDITGCEEVLSKIETALDAMARTAARGDTVPSAPAGFQVH